MIVVACVLLYLGIVKGFEPLLLVGIAFGCLLANVSYFPGLDAVNPDLNATNALYHPELWSAVPRLQQRSIYHSYGHILSNAGLLDIFYIGVKAGLYPSLIFMGVGAMTDFGPLIADPKSLLLGAAAQLGVFVAFFGAICLGFTGPQAASIGIIGGADGPTAIFLTNKLAPELLGAIAIAAYSYMALIPLIQPPDHEAPDHARRTARSRWCRRASGLQEREDPLPDHRHHLRHPAPAVHGSADRLPDARQPLP